ncbi:fructosamine kinase family protein [Streptomyces albidus (ex Kaewkla and Franco 2022)]|uniref:fructosamine kinase family protein n=1 Tax=Streptomyces albidus (ex Kaewkla and Franco 2022) TaxID=722709 RepID=UPI0015EE816A|nr:fructosamine kinase family protein [Streptomyces albidus (ex Kaewkla and Franco 2022)]
MSALADRVAQMTGAATVTDPERVPGGDISDAWRLTLSGGEHGSHRTVFAKTLDTVPPPGFFEAEAAGLAMLAFTGVVAVPEVLAVEDDVLVLDWVEQGAPDAAQAERLGRDLAALHDNRTLAYGTPGRPAYLGTLRLLGPDEPVTEPEDWPAFHAEYRLRPFLRDAFDNGAISAADTLDVERVCERIDQLAGPPQLPVLIHGDLWSGNVHWAADGRARLIDPAAQGGHPETDLALLELFGCPELSRILAAYQEVSPIEGREERVPLHQLQHLLAHAVLFGSAYGAQCGAAARAALARAA